MDSPAKRFNVKIEQIKLVFNKPDLKMMLCANKFFTLVGDKEIVCDMSKLSTSDRFRIALWWLAVIIGKPDFGKDLRDVVLLQRLLGSLVTPEECSALAIDLRNNLAQQDLGKV